MQMLDSATSMCAVRSRYLYTILFIILIALSHHKYPKHIHVHALEKEFANRSPTFAKPKNGETQGKVAEDRNTDKKGSEDDIVLKTGDKIKLLASDGTYLKRFEPLLGRPALVSYKHIPDPTSVFTLTFQDANKVLLQADNGRYLKRFCCWDGHEIITIEYSQPDNFSVFELRRNGTSYLLVADNGKLLKLHPAPSAIPGYKDGKVVVAAQDDVPSEDHLRIELDSSA